MKRAISSVLCALALLTAIAIYSGAGGASEQKSSSCTTAGQSCSSTALQTSIVAAQAVTTEPAVSPDLVNTSSWNTFLTDNAAGGTPWNSNNLGGSGIDAGGYDTEYFSPSHVSQKDGTISISATPGSSQPGDTWTSGVLTSYGHESFDGGEIEVDAKIPNTTTGAWPGIWMLGGPQDPKSDEIDIFEGGLTYDGDDSNDNFSGFVHTDGQQGGTTTASGQVDTVDTGIDLSAGYHVYAIKWVPGISVTWYLDGKEIARVTSRQLRIPSAPMELVIDTAMASASASGWHTVTTGTVPNTMIVRSITYIPETTSG